MFSALTQLLRTTAPRRTEESDTRQALQRHDPEHHRRKKKQSDKETVTLDEDGAVIVSVDALSAFLKTISQSRTSQSSAQSSDETKAGAQENHPDPLDYKIQQEMDLGNQTEEKAPRAPHAAKAASSYQSTQNAQKKDTVLLETTDTAAHGPEFDLSAVDTRSIHRLRDELKILSQHNIEYLHIQRAESFLQSLENAVETAKAQIS